MFDVEKILKQHVAVLGKTGGGKTSTSKWLIEFAVQLGERACILDTIKSDWWGMISSADGLTPGFDFVILGGPHGHIPLHADAGAAIGKLVATGELPLSIIDMSEFKPGGQAKFFTAFAESLMKHMKGVLHLGIEEAHELAPKERSGVGDENMSVYYAKKLATAGRSKGIRMIVNSQRTQALHNAVLGSCETVIVHRMTAPADQEPVLKWLRGNIADKALRAEIESSLPKLKAGEAWVCSGLLEHPQRIVFPRIQTFDNSATPDGNVIGEKPVSVKLDLERLLGLVGESVREANASDPKILKARITELESKLRANINQPPVAKAELQAEYQRGYGEGQIDGYRDGRKYQAKRDVEIARGIVSKIDNDWSDVEADVHNPGKPIFVPDDWGTNTTLRQGDSHEARNKRTAIALAAIPPKSNRPDPVIGLQSKLSPSARKIVDAIHRAYPVSMTFVVAARRAGISNKSSAYSKYCKEVMACDELIVGDGPGGRLASKPEYANKGPRPDSVQLWADKLPPSMGAMLLAISLAGRAGLDKQGVASEANISPTSSGLGSGLRELLELELIEKEGDIYVLAEGL